MDAEQLPPGQRALLYGRGLLLLWLALAAGPVVWALDLQTAYLLVYRACHTRSFAPLYVETAIALGVVALAIGASWRMLGWFPDASLEGGQGDDRARMMVVIAVGLNVLFFLILVAAAVPRFVLDPCL